MSKGWRELVNKLLITAKKWGSMALMGLGLWSCVGRRKESEKLECSAEGRYRAAATGCLLERPPQRLGARTACPPMWGEAASTIEKETVLSKDPTPTWNASFHHLVTNSAWECSLTKEQKLIRGMLTPEPEVQNHYGAGILLEALGTCQGRGLSRGNRRILAVMLPLLGGTC